jgi:hypothetical protein
VGDVDVLRVEGRKERGEAVGSSFEWSWRFKAAGRGRFRSRGRSFEGSRLRFSFWRHFALVVLPTIRGG